MTSRRTAIASAAVLAGTSTVLRGLARAATSTTAGRGSAGGLRPGMVGFMPRRRCRCWWSCSSPSAARKRRAGRRPCGASCPRRSGPTSTIATRRPSRIGRRRRSRSSRSSPSGSSARIRRCTSSASNALFHGGATIVNVHSGQPDQRRVIDFYGSKVLPAVAAARGR